MSVANDSTTTTNLSDNMPVIKTQNELDSTGRYRIFIRGADDIISDCADCSIERILHGYKRLLKDGDSRGRRGYHYRRKKKMPIENPALYIPIVYTVVPNQQGAFVVDLIINNTSAAKAFDETRGDFVAMSYEDCINYMESFGTMCAYDIRAFFEDTYRAKTATQSTADHRTSTAQ